MPKINHIKKLLFILLIVLLAKSSYANTHYVCTDSTFYLNSLQKHPSGIFSNYINQDDTLLLHWDAMITLIPDTVNPEFYWWIGELNTCDYQKITGEDTLGSTQEGIYYYGDVWSSYNFSFYVIVVDWYKGIIDVTRSTENDEEFILSLPDYYSEYQWSTGDATNYAIVNQSDSYSCLMGTYCDGWSTRSINLELVWEIQAGVCDSSTMICKKIMDTNPAPGTQTWLLEYFIDIDEDGTDDIYYYNTRQQSGSFVWDIIKIQPFGNYSVCVDGVTGIANRIQDGDLVGSKQYWNNYGLIIVKQYMFELGRPINCDIGWNPYEQGVNIGLKNVDGHQTVFGWLKVNFLGSGGHELIIGMQRKKELATRHFVCTDSVFYMNSRPGLSLDTIPNTLYPDDTVFLLPGASFTLIPDTIIPENQWDGASISHCSSAPTGPWQDTLKITAEGRYCYNENAHGFIGFELAAIDYDSSSLIIDVSRKSDSEDEYILDVPEIYEHYLWNNDDTTSHTIINKSGSYSITVWDYCGNTYSKDIYIDINPEVYAGIYDPSTMVTDTIVDVDIDIEWDYADEEFMYDLDGDSIADIYYKLYWTYHTSGHARSFKIKSFNDYYINMSQRNCLVNPIKKDDNIVVKQAWINNETLLIGGLSWGVGTFCGGGKTGWDPYWPETGEDFYIGIKKIEGDKEEYGWAKVQFDSTSSHYFIYSIQSEAASIPIIPTENLLIYPNPAQNRIFISSKSKEIDEISIYTLAGQCVLTKSKINNSVDVSRLVSGMYIMHIITDENRIVQKLVIQR